MQQQEIAKSEETAQFLVMIWGAPAWSFFPGALYASLWWFGAILQGDHLGVEFGSSAHVGLLQSEGLLPDRGRLVADALVRPAAFIRGSALMIFSA